jgi:Domain of unknown function (DUF1707)
VSTGPGERAGHGRMRAGHADREQVITELKAAFVQGRLDQDELEERAGQAVASRTYAELAALTADIPAPADLPAAASAPAAGTPGRTLAKAAGRAGVCVLAAVALTEAGFLTGNFLLIVAAFFAAIAATGFLGYGILDAIGERSARAQLTPGPGQGLGGPGSAGRPPRRGLVPPGGRDDQNLAETRARRPRPAGGLQRGWAVS